MSIVIIKVANLVLYNCVHANVTYGRTIKRQKRLKYGSILHTLFGGNIIHTILYEWMGNETFSAYIVKCGI